MELWHPPSALVRRQQHHVVMRDGSPRCRPAKSTGRAGAESSDAVAAVLERTVALYIVENVVAPSEEAPESECTHTLS